MTCRGGAALLLLFTAASCSEPRLAGVLTLAPAGMMLSEGASAQDDGTALLAAGSSATTTSYAPQGALEAAIVGSSLAAGTVTVEIYFDGRLVGTTEFVAGQGEQRRELRFEVGRDGPHTWKLVVRGAGGPGASKVFHFQRLVIRIA